MKSNYSTIFMVSALIFMMLPFISTFNEFLTAILLKWRLYQILENIVVPYEAKLIAGILSVLPVGQVSAGQNGIWVAGNFLELQWNCLGWQSVVLLGATLLTGFQGSFSLVSRIEVVVIGILGTFIINILRISIVGILVSLVNITAAMIFHDWLSLTFIILWFFVFWWFSYSFVLEEKE